MCQGQRYSAGISAAGVGVRDGREGFKAQLLSHIFGEEWQSGVFQPLDFFLNFFGRS